MPTLACDSPVHLVDGFLPFFLLLAVLPVTWAGVRAMRRAAELGERPDGPTWTGALFAVIEAFPLGLLGAIAGAILPVRLPSDVFLVPLPLASFLTVWLGSTLLVLAFSRAPVPHLRDGLLALLRVASWTAAPTLLVSIFISQTVLMGGPPTILVTFVTFLVAMGVLLPFVAVGAAIGRRLAQRPAPPDLNLATVSRAVSTSGASGLMRT